MQTELFIILNIKTFEFLFKYLSHICLYDGGPFFLFVREHDIVSFPGNIRRNLC